MTDLVQAFYERDLNAAEMDALEQLLETSSSEAQRFHRLAEAQGQAWGLKAPQFAKAKSRRAWGLSWRLAWMPALALVLGIWILRPGAPAPWTDHGGGEGSEEQRMRGSQAMREEGYENFKGDVAGVRFERWDLYQGQVKLGRRYRVHNSTARWVKVKVKVLSSQNAVENWLRSDQKDGWISVGPYRRVDLGGMTVAKSNMPWSFELKILDEVLKEGS